MTLSSKQPLTIHLKDDALKAVKNAYILPNILVTSAHGVKNQDRQWKENIGKLIVFSMNHPVLILCRYDW